MKTYVPQKPCKRGHMLRYTSNKACALCKYPRLYATEAERERSRRRYAENREEWRLKRAEYIKTHLEEHKARCKNWREQNKTRMKQLISEWAKNNPGKRAKTSAEQRAKRLLRVPKWLTEGDFEQISAFYEAAAGLTRETGVEHHVDHEIPLLGKRVSGLHIPKNLRIVSAEVNLRKSNVYVDA